MSDRNPTVVYVSSTFEDLVAYRAAVLQQIASMSMRPVAMEMATAEERPPLASCLAAVKSSDVYVGIFAHRYGFIPPGETQSITELEYRAAGDADIDRLVFLVEDRQPWRPSDSDAYDPDGDGGSRIRQFRNELQLLKTVQFFTTPENLALKVAAALHDWIETKRIAQASLANLIDSAFRAYLEDCIHKEEELHRKYVALSGTGVRPVPPPTAFPAQLVPRSFRVIQISPTLETENELVPSIAAVIERYPQVVILGDPGSGKSTTLHYLQYITAQKALDGGGPVPLYINLAEWPESVPDLKSLLVHEREIKGCPSIPASRLLLLLDGLNEVRERDYVTCIDHIQRWLDENPAAKMIVAARQQQYLQNRKLRTATVTIHPLTDPQVEEFVEKYLGADDARVLLERIDWASRHQANLRHFARLTNNPFQLALLCYVYAESGRTLPSTRGELLRILAQTVYQREADLGTHGLLTYLDMQAALGELALSAVQARSSTAIDLTWAAKRMPPGIDFTPLQRLSVNAGLLRLSKNDRFIQFSHQLILEYFAAERLSSHLERMSDVVRKPRFQNGERSPQATDEVCHTLAEIHPDVDTAIDALALVDPFLAADALIESQRNASDDLKRRVASSLVQMQKVQGDSARGALLSRLPLLGDASLDALQQLLSTGSKPERRLAVKALGTMDSVKAFEQLAVSLVDRDRWVRREARDALLSVADRRPQLAATYLQEHSHAGLAPAVRDLLFPRDERADASSPAIAETPLLRAPVLAIDLTPLLSWAEQHVAARRIPVPFLKRQLTDDAVEDVVPVPAAVEERHDDASVQELLAFLGEAPPGKANGIINALARHGCDAVPELIDALDSSNPRLRRRIPRVLAKIGDPRAIKPLTLLLDDWYTAVAEHAARALSVLADSEHSTMQLFLSLKSNKNGWIQIFALKGLMKVGGDSAYQYLLPYLDDKRDTVRLEVIKMLATANAPVPVENIVRFTKSRNREIRKAALRWLLGCDASQGLGRILEELKQRSDALDLEMAVIALIAVIAQLDQKPFRSGRSRPHIPEEQIPSSRQWLNENRGELDRILRDIATEAIRGDKKQLAEQAAIALYLLNEPTQQVRPSTPTSFDVHA